jgi:hypothetical protein
MNPDTPVQSFGSFISDIYQYSLQLVGLFVFLMMLYAGFKLMFGKTDEAKKIIQNGVIGAILLFSAYVILNTINPDLVGQPTRPIPPLQQTQ